MTEAINSQQNNPPLEVRYRPQDPNKPVIVSQETTGGRQLFIETTKRGDGAIKVRFMGQEFFIPDEAYQRFLPEALRASIDKLNEVQK